MIKVVVIDGIIGCGKTTGIDVLHRKISTDTDWTVLIVKEPVDLWKDNGRLALFYGDMKRRSYQFQTRAFHDRTRVYQRVWNQAKELEEEGKDVLLLMERSIFSDRIFAGILHEQGFMDDTELEDYIDLWEMWTEILPKTPDIFVYLRPSLETVMGRLRSRNRSEEAGVAEEYQRLLMLRHDEYYAAEEQTLNGQQCSMHTLDTDFDYRDSEEGAGRLTSMVLAVL